MILSIQKFWCRLWGWTWSETPLPSAIVVWLVVNRKPELKVVYLRQDTAVYPTISWADVRRSIWITLTHGIWPMICKFYRSDKQSKLAYDFFYDADYKAICYSLDGAFFSFPFSDIPEIDRLMTEYPTPGV
ncbi:hypothetical protein GP644_08455 [Parasedimentitalea maritima]|uniref:Uncharacterized protein n=1 Tax=Parasedimentitalea maritima TaxID=2578117 RepID=A0A6A4RJQ7_9RHOB|nr:hypothetical protein GP644_08455 [Zongyanglinia marina]